MGGQRQINNLTEVVRSEPSRPAYRGKCHYPPFWAHSRTVPQGGKFLSLLCLSPCKIIILSINASPNEFLARLPADPPT